MVSQAAAKTRFRALKHENGIAGSATIIVRIIACYQPLLDCQAEYFRHLLKPVTVGHWVTSQEMKSDARSCDYWQNLPWQSVNSYYDATVDLQDPALWKPRRAPEFPSYADGLGPGRYGDVPTGVEAPVSVQRTSAVCPHLDPSNAPPPEAGATAAVTERRFVIFDQSGSGTRMLFSSVGPPSWNLNHASPKPGLLYDHGTAGRDQTPGSDAPANLSGRTEVHDGTECDEMREDTDEIDALLYSESEFDENVNEDAEDDDISKGRIPQAPMASAEEVCSNSVPNLLAKRRRLTEEEAVDASLMDTASSAAAHGRRGRSDGYGDDESGCMGTGTVDGQQPPTVGAAGTGLKRARVQETLCVLRKIIPGGKDKDDGEVIDEAIRYLRCMKLKATALGGRLK